ncbi:hypothetical protein AM493_14190 [Flavobacterium akiainvivens]|uniref:Outer membrane protein beta-barrel domain-containing protein n=1 Tax=Flavobacterium akiainvivens TaxID=1202724 RepID=A0A0M8MEA0_9FLAO|nr:hypothetical protein [Flavobacterium akiainvivens]KOS07054.1 hypothetical protein AM493_14190 [Flavobacterium akiainvivens]SFQ58710.1 hypothetical protein SAMN05444144_10935 [Flavobacterium akiainvivens]
MKKFLLLGICLQAFCLFAQNKRTFGLTAGINEYYASPTFITSKSGTGLSAGLVKGFRLSKKSDLVFEGSFIWFNTKFYGQDMRQNDPEWIKFNSKRVGLSALYYYDLLRLKKENITFGLHAGPTVTYINNFTMPEKESMYYELYPYDYPAGNMKISSVKGEHLNAFATVGLNVYHNNMELNFRYNFAINSPYRKLDTNTGAINIGGKDDFASITFTYYFFNR